MSWPKRWCQDGPVTFAMPPKWTGHFCPLSPLLGCQTSLSRCRETLEPPYQLSYPGRARPRANASFIPRKLKRYLNPLSGGNGLTRSMCTCSKRVVGTAIGITGGFVWIAILLLWQTWHCFDQAKTSRRMFAHTYALETMANVALPDGWRGQQRKAPVKASFLRTSDQISSLRQVLIVLSSKNSFCLQPGGQQPRKPHTVRSTYFGRSSRRLAPASSTRLIIVLLEYHRGHDHGIQERFVDRGQGGSIYPLRCCSSLWSFCTAPSIWQGGPGDLVYCGGHELRVEESFGTDNQVLLRAVEVGCGGPEAIVGFLEATEGRWPVSRNKKRTVWHVRTP